MFGHDYAVPGTYEVTMVVADRNPVFGEIVGTTRGDGEKPRLKPSALGQAVLDTEVPKIRQHYPMVDVWQVCLMPDHLHMIVRINQPLPQGKHLGIIIGAFKGGISRTWWQSTAATAPGAPAPSSPAACPSATVPAASAAGSAPSSRPSLFEPGYNDHILMRDGQLETWKRYLRDNPLRYMMRREYPDLFQRALCLTIGGCLWQPAPPATAREAPSVLLSPYRRRPYGKLRPLED